MIVESPEGILIVDGGPNKNLYKFMRHRYWYQLKDGGQVNINALVVSHPDWDHFNGLTAILKDPQFTVGKIYHNGIIRYDDGNIPPNTSFNLGKTSVKSINGEDREVLTETFSTLDHAQTLITQGHLMSSFKKFWQAAIDAKAEGRFGTAKRLTMRDDHLSGYGSGGDNELLVEVLGPVCTKSSGAIEYVNFPSTERMNANTFSASSSHTRNGHSVVLKLTFGDHTVLLGGDLNIPAERHLIEFYEDQENPFKVDVAKACHHGSSDYDVDFLKLVRPRVNVFSSGDNKSFDHPMADALGAAARHTRGNHPLLFSTELARANSSSGTHYGLINLRSNGKVMAMAQMKEQHKGKADVWDSYTVPWHGKF